MLKPVERAFRAGLPYLVAVAGAAAITAAIAVLRGVLDLPSLVVAYLLLVLVVGALWGSPPAFVGAVVSFAAYDFFFVPPVGSFFVSAPRELLNLLVLLLAALVGGQLAARLRRGRTQAQAAAAESSALSAVAMEALQATDVPAALGLVCERCARLPSIAGVTLVALESGAATAVAGPAPSPEELREARWSSEHDTPVGVRLTGGSLVRLRGYPEDRPYALLPLAGGTAVIRWTSRRAVAAELRLLAGYLALAGLLLDRRRAALEADRLREVEAADSLKSAVLSSLSHELKSPLASLRAGLTTLSMPESGVSAEQRELLLGLDRQASRLDRLVGDLLDMSRLEAGARLDRRLASYQELLGAVVQRMGGQLETYRLELDLPESLPAVSVDELQIDRLLTNLLQNAVDWAPSGGRIAMGAAVRDGWLQGWVENEGPSIPPADLGRVFHKFWTGRAGGSGLGLAMCRQIVEAHGGRISVRNSRSGPRFTFTLPLADERAEERP